MNVRQPSWPLIVVATVGFAFGRLHWFDVIFCPLAAVIVCPDHLRAWTDRRYGRRLPWCELWALEVIALGTTALLLTLLVPRVGDYLVWVPLLFVGLLGAIRGVRALVCHILGIEEP